MSATAQKPMPQSVHNATDTDLPEGWAAVTLPDICELNPPKPRSDALPPNALVTFVPMPAVDAELGAITAPAIRNFSEVRKGFTAFRNGDVIFAKITPCMENGKSAIARDLKNGLGFGSTEFHVLRPSNAVLADFIYHFIRQEVYRKAAESEMTGSVGQKRVPIDFLKRTEIHLPPLAEQKRIVAKVEELLTQVNAARERLAKVPRILKRFRQSVLAAACSGQLTADWRNQNIGIESGARLVDRVAGPKAVATVPDDEDPVDLPTLPEEWTWSRCEHLCVPARAITYGVIKLGPSFERGVPTLRSSDVRWLHIDDAHVKRISPTIAADYSRTFLEGGEILVTVRGSLGGVAVVPPRMARFNISREVAMLPLYLQFNPQFFCYAIASIWSQNWLSEVTKGVAYTGINIRDLKRLPLPVPPYSEQIEIVRRVEALFKLADAIEKRLEAATKRADKLTRAILGKAFRGELVPTEAELARREGRTYEPASALLERSGREKESKSEDKTKPNPSHKARKVPQQA